MGLQIEKTNLLLQQNVTLRSRATSDDYSFVWIYNSIRHHFREIYDILFSVHIWELLM